MTDFTFVKFTTKRRKNEHGQDTLESEFLDPSKNVAYDGGMIDEKEFEIICDDIPEMYPTSNSQETKQKSASPPYPQKLFSPSKNFKGKNEYSSPPFKGNGGANCAEREFKGVGSDKGCFGGGGVGGLASVKGQLISEGHGEDHKPKIKKGRGQSNRDSACKTAISGNAHKGIKKNFRRFYIADESSLIWDWTNHHQEFCVGGSIVLWSVAAHYKMSFCANRTPTSLCSRYSKMKTAAESSCQKDVLTWRMMVRTSTHFAQMRQLLSNAKIPESDLQFIYALFDQVYWIHECLRTGSIVPDFFTLPSSTNTKNDPDDHDVDDCLKTLSKYFFWDTEKFHNVRTDALIESLYLAQLHPNYPLIESALVEKFTDKLVTHAEKLNLNIAPVPLSRSLITSSKNKENENDITQFSIEKKLPLREVFKYALIAVRNSVPNPLMLLNRDCNANGGGLHPTTRLKKSKHALTANSRVSVVL